MKPVRVVALFAGLLVAALLVAYSLAIIHAPQTSCLFTQFLQILEFYD